MNRLRLPAPDETGIALVVFSGDADLNWLRVLKTGFRHCFIVLESGGCWVIYDPLSHRTDISVVEGDDVFDLIQLYRARGMRVVPWVVRCPAKNGGADGTLHLRRSGQTHPRHSFATDHNALESI